MVADSNDILDAPLLINYLLKDIEGVSIYQDGAPAEGGLPVLIHSIDQIDVQAVKAGRPADTAIIGIDIWSRDEYERRDIAKKVRNALDGKTAVLPGSGLRMRSCILENAQTGMTEEGIYVFSMQFRIKI